MNNKELRKLIRSMNDEDLNIFMIKNHGNILVRRWGSWMTIDNFDIFDDGSIMCQECPAWSVRFKDKKTFSYNIKSRSKNNEN